MLLAGALWCLPAAAQISGAVTATENGKSLPIPGANVYWEGTSQGTATDENGRFTLEKPAGATTLVAQAIGYTTVKKSVIARKGTINFTLQAEASQLNEVAVSGQAKATSVDLKSPGLTYNLDEKELRKAACCNLSESFETNASVDVSFTDAVTGTRQIEMLGLAGKYVLLQRENVPYARGLNANTGLQFIPGPFVESLQLTKGLASVVNGYESLTGQINVEFHKPSGTFDFQVNGYMNAGTRLESNILLNTPISRTVETMVLAHYSTNPVAHDRNGDGFVDMPTGEQINFMNRWRFAYSDDWHGQIGLTYVKDLRESGQLPDVHSGEQGPHTAPWIYTSNNQRVELFGKTGYAPFAKDYSLGIVYSLSRQEADAILGSRELNSFQNSGYLNVIFQDQLGSEKHEIRTGASFQIDEVSEILQGPLVTTGTVALQRTEMVPGIFAEYSYAPNPRVTAVAGGRVDFHNLFGTFVTPRVHLRYMATDRTTLRLGGGRGQRTASPITENLNGLAGNRVFHLNPQQMLPEIGWNVGGSVTHSFFLFGRTGTLSGDAYYTWFEQKLIADFDVLPQQFWLYYAQGSASFTGLAQVDYEVVKDVDLRLAYKFLDSRDAFRTGMDLAYRLPQHRAFANVAYEFGTGWKADLTLNWFGKARMPSTTDHPAAYQYPDNSPAYTTTNVQLNKVWKNGWEAYIGAENLFNYQQSNPVVAANNTASPFFDTNQVYGPIFGRNLYVGFYYRLPKK